MSFQFVNVDYEHPMSKASNGGEKQQSLERGEWQLCFAALICCSMGWMEQGLLTVAQKPICSRVRAVLTHKIYLILEHTQTHMPPFPRQHSSPSSVEQNSQQQIDRQG